MDFTEEKTPAGITLKIMFKHWKYMAFDSKGSSIYADQEGRTLLHKIPSFTFLGKTLSLQKKYERDYELIKLRNNEIILPYFANRERKYLFIAENLNIDIIPALINEFESYSVMLKTLPSGTNIDYLIIDETISEIELSVIASKYKPNEIINIQSENTKQENNKEKSDNAYSNVNIMSDNPVFLAQIHLRNMALSNLNQILLDFEISAFDTQYIVFFINDMLKKISQSDAGEQNILMLDDLKNSFEFYLALLEKDMKVIDEKINDQSDYRKLAPFRTLLSKVRSSATTQEEQLLYNEYENHILEFREKLISQEK